MSGQRHRGRESALQVMYQVDAGTEPKQALQDFFNHFALSQEGIDFARELVHGTTEQLALLDEKITSHSPKWRLDRMPVVDRNILRLGTYELTFTPDLPPKVVLNEWIEVAKRYGSEQSGSFINGVLDSML
ncbi:MAG: transcription antitermination factor NusB [Myxococcaceae bacterium]|nr:transcription antitermination factor NusB [Myxococcaceae bacterium]MBH2006303.1 transcription antitermination factor NusB [Myxococcaceae bacterium]